MITPLQDAVREAFTEGFHLLGDVHWNEPGKRAGEVSALLHEIEGRVQRAVMAAEAPPSLPPSKVQGDEETETRLKRSMGGGLPKDDPAGMLGEDGLGA